MLVKRLPKFIVDKNLLILLNLIILILIIGIVLQISAGNGNFYKFALPQIFKILIGFIIFFFIYFLNTSFIFSMAELFYIACCLLLVLVEIFGTIKLGAQRWLHLGLFTIQPSELMKIAVILLICKILHKIPSVQEGRLKNYFLPLILAIIPSLFVLAQPDLGTTIIVIATTIIIFFISGLKIRYFIIAVTLCAITTPLIWYKLYNYQKERLLIFLNPYKDPLGKGYHIIQSKIAIGSGGIIGKGFLQGSQSQLNFIPEKHTDFIFSLLTEEFGFLGALTLLILYALIITFCLLLALKNNCKFARYTIVGFTFILFIQIFFNIGMVTGILPVVGIPLPLISYGGTSIITNLSMLALIINFSKNYNYYFNK